VKNKVAPPFRATEFDLIYGEGISSEGELLALGEKYKFITKSGSSYTYLPPGGDASTEVKLGRGYDAARTTIKQDPKLKAEILKHIRKALKEEAGK
jgi:recombination protein RecA